MFVYDDKYQIQIKINVQFETSRYDSTENRREHFYQPNDMLLIQSSWFHFFLPAFFFRLFRWFFNGRNGAQSLMMMNSMHVLRY